jgi:hypothetical protein
VRSASRAVHIAETPADLRVANIVELAGGKVPERPVARIVIHSQNSPRRVRQTPYHPGQICIGKRRSDYIFRRSVLPNLFTGENSTSLPCFRKYRNGSADFSDCKNSLSVQKLCHCDVENSGDLVHMAPLWLLLSFTALEPVAPLFTVPDTTKRVQAQGNCQYLIEAGRQRRFKAHLFPARNSQLQLQVQRACPIR